MNWGWVEIIFVAVVALSLGFWQLWSVNREIARDKAAKSAGDARHSIGEHGADDRQL